MTKRAQEQPLRLCRWAVLLLHSAVAALSFVAQQSIRAAVWFAQEPEGLRPSVCIESGTRGFELIDVQELERTAIEHFGIDEVYRSTITDPTKYLATARSEIRRRRPRFYLTDPRSGSQSQPRAVLQSFGLACILAWYGVTPVVWLTDAPLRRWRMQAEVLTAAAGLAFTLVNPTQSEIRFVHRRFRGPTLLPMSRATLRMLAELRNVRPSNGSPCAVFVGSLYEPRTTEIRRVHERLTEVGYELELKTREAGGPRISDVKYWKTLASADVVFTTASQVHEAGTDWTSEPHLIYRYTEALAAGAALVAPVVPGSGHLLESGVHFAGYETEDDAVALIVKLLEHEDQRKDLGERGRTRITLLASETDIWAEVSKNLGGQRERTEPNEPEKQA